MSPESNASADEVLPQSRLGFVKPEGCCLAHRHAIVLRIETLIIESMTDLVKQRENSMRQIVREKARCNANVTRTDHRAEWMLACIDSCAVEIKAC